MPERAGDYNGIEDDDGCPDRDRFVGPGREPPSRLPTDPTLFDDNSATIRSGAASVLDLIAAFINDRPTIRRVTIAGHAAAHETSPAPAPRR